MTISTIEPDQPMTRAEEQERERWITERAQAILDDPSELMDLPLAYEPGSRFWAILSQLACCKAIRRESINLYHYLMEFALRQAEDEWEQENRK